MTKHTKNSGAVFFMKIIFPTILAIGLFVFAIFVVIVPTFEKNSLDYKREMIQMLTDSAWSILDRYYQAEQSGELTREQAQQYAISDVRHLRYGLDRKDYFWINDLEPKMIMHPYRPDMEGQSLLEYQDTNGKKIFVAFVDIVKRQGQGYVDYTWQWKDDPKRNVPKLSYVKEFEPWGWIIGTGIYIEDVKEEIAELTSRLIYISLSITVIILLLLVFIIQQSLRIERQRQNAEFDLHQSREKYRALVEAATEGAAMVIGNRFVFFNKTMQDMLGYTDKELSELKIEDILPEHERENEHGLQYFNAFITDQTVPPKFEAQLKHKNGNIIDVVLALSRISFADMKGYILIANDISRHKEIEEELGQRRKQYTQLTNAINIGVFRATTGRNSRLVEANPALLSMLGIEQAAGIGLINLSELFHDSKNFEDFIGEIIDKGQIINKIIHLQKKDGSMPTALLSAVDVRDDDGVSRYYDGVIEDVTEQKKAEQERENLIAQLQSSLLFLNEPIRLFLRNNLTCEMNMPIFKAAELMARQNFSAILIVSEKNEAVGIVTDSDLRKRVLGQTSDLNRPVFTIMSSSLVTISDNALIFEAFLKMQEHGVQHLAVKDNTGKISNIVRSRDLLQLHHYSSTFMFKEIHSADSVNEIVDINKRQPQVIRRLVETGTNAKSITHVITAITDSIVEKYISFAIKELGRPPVAFSFIALGSQGREEQTLITDQDNAVIYDDTSGNEKDIKDYFIRLGERVCDWLHKTGYTYCNGQVMAKNPKWCMSLGSWKEQFKQWIETSAPQDFREFNIFFDFRPVYGDKNLTLTLREYVYDLLKNNAPFFMHFALDALHYKPPIGMFGKIVLESSGESPKTFSIKDAMLPIVNFARLYALHNRIYETNTLDRLYKLYEKNILKKDDYEESIVSYNYLMQLRLKHQAQEFDNNIEPDNNINPKELAHIDETTLRETFYQVNRMQKRISIEFTGSA